MQNLELDSMTSAVGHGYNPGTMQIGMRQSDKLADALNIGIQSSLGCSV